MRRLLRFVRPHIGLFATSFVVLGALFALDLVGPWMWKHAIDGPVRAAIDAKDSAARFGIDVDVRPFVREFGWWVAAYFLVVAISIVFRYFEVAQLNKTGQVVISDLRQQ